MIEEYIPISEFAARAGVSKQAVYSRLDSQEIDPFVKVDNSGKRPQKLINTAALEFFSAKPVKPVDSHVVDYQRQEIERLESQIQTKDQTIAALLDQVQQLQKQNLDLSSHMIDQGKELSRLLDQQQQLQQAQQVLYARLQAPADPAEDQSQDEPEPEPKKGFFRRLFGL